MENIASQVSGHRQTIRQASVTLARALADIAELQAKCTHNMVFIHQVNAFHEHNWNVTRKCTVCDLEKTAVQRPVCEVDGHRLERANSRDKEAEKERLKPKYEGDLNPPIAFRCTHCKKIHILWLEGD